MARRGDEQGERGALGVGERVTNTLERYPYALRLAEGRAGGPLEPARHTGIRP